MNKREVDPTNVYPIQWPNLVSFDTLEATEAKVQFFKDFFGEIPEFEQGRDFVEKFLTVNDDTPVKLVMGRQYLPDSEGVAKLIVGCYCEDLKGFDLVKNQTLPHKRFLQLFRLDFKEVEPGLTRIIHSTEDEDELSATVLQFGNPQSSRENQLNEFRDRIFLLALSNQQVSEALTVHNVFVAAYLLDNYKLKDN